MMKYFCDNNENFSTVPSFVSWACHCVATLWHTHSAWINQFSWKHEFCFRREISHLITFNWYSDGSEEDQQRAAGSGSWSSCSVFRWTRGWGFVPLAGEDQSHSELYSNHWLIAFAGHYHGTPWQSIPGRRFLSHHPLPHWLPIQASQGRLHNQDLPPQHQQQWLHLPRHPPVSVVTCSHHQQGWH